MRPFAARLRSGALPHTCAWRQMEVPQDAVELCALRHERLGRRHVVTGQVAGQRRIGLLEACMCPRAPARAYRCAVLTVCCVQFKAVDGGREDSRRGHAR
jgi:hypothetical protein